MIRSFFEIRLAAQGSEQYAVNTFNNLFITSAKGGNAFTPGLFSEGADRGNDIFFVFL